MKKLDAAESIFFEKELEKVLNKTYDIKYAELKARTLIPTNLEEDPGCEIITYEIYDMFGFAKIVESYAKDFPRVDVVAEEKFSKVKSLGDSYGYSIQDIRKAAKAGKPLVSRKASAAKRAIMQKENQLALFGDAKCGFTGLLNNPNVPILAATGAFSGLTPDQVLADLNRLANAPIINTKGVEVADTAVFDISTYTFLSSTKMGVDTTVTILEMFLKSNPNITGVEWLNESATADAAGTGPRAMVYKRSPEALEMMVPMDFEQFEAHLHAMEYVVHCHQRYGGVLFYYPLSAAYMDGI